MSEVNEQEKPNYDFCRQCKRVVPEGTAHDWVSHQPKRLQPVLKKLGFTSALTAEQRAAVIARVFAVTRQKRNRSLNRKRGPTGRR